MSELIVAKFGGTSAAQPQVVMDHIQSRQLEVTVVSAAGSDEGQPRTARMTKILESDLDGERLRKTVANRLGVIGSRAGIDVGSYLSRADQDLAEWDPGTRAALGEKWSAELFVSGLQARGVDAEFADPRDFIRFDNHSGKLDTLATYGLTRERLGTIAATKTVIVPGFYGADEVGNVHVLPTGGSDLTGALIARALGAAEYQNWSDVDGYYTADPRLFPTAGQIAAMTYAEKRELGNGGNGLLHRQVSKILEGHGIPTRMLNTFSTEAGSTLISDSRDTVDTVPIVGVTLQKMIELRLTARDEKAGETVRIYQKLDTAGIPYKHVTTATDALSVFLDEEYADAAHAALHGEIEESSHVDAIHVVGEGLRARQSRLHAIAIESRLLGAQIPDRGEVNMGQLPSKTYMVPSGDGEATVVAIIDGIAV